ncbi:hypothetical protein [Aerobium aerolatum]|uniref:Uncharacterized protein n=1 Tax=Aquamicrobium aerolatum DSM 21857 TaxID=1121003 RepID=A0A1I3JGZ8_9HYPH|nr:hypothetical protein [Aquamicrobium aerolatum]SFI59553.1 hypothetical protein SAMN03080618_00854 [Aquamicrobium aerolatum DSM 21857]
MTDMIQIDRTKIVDAFAQFLASADPAKPAEEMLDIQTITQLAEKGRELAAAGAFRNRTIYSETCERLMREGYSQAEMVAISEIGLQVGRAVNAAFMNAAGVYSSTAKLLRAFEKDAEAANDEREAIEAGDEVPVMSDDDIDANMQAEGFYWDEESKGYIDADYRHMDPQSLHPNVVDALDRVTKKYDLAH